MHIRIRKESKSSNAGSAGLVMLGNQFFAISPEERAFALDWAMDHLKQGHNVIPHPRGGVICDNCRTGCAGPGVGAGNVLIAEVKAQLLSEGNNA